MLELLIYIAAILAMACLCMAGSVLLNELRRMLEDEDLSDSEGGGE